MALVRSLFILAVTAFLGKVAGSALRNDERFCQNLMIVGGKPIKDIKDAPFMAAILDRDWAGTDVAACGGSIINKDFILTAASCIRFEPFWKPQVIVGTASINGPNGYIIEVAKYICHEKYNDKTKDNDICLLKLANSIPIGPEIGRIALPSQDTPIGLFNVTGWGTTSITTMVENDLHQTIVPFVTKECCSKMYRGKIQLTENHICAGSFDHDACLGDTGSPLTHNGVQFGISTYGEGCGTNPGVYTKVANYREWIDTTINNHTEPLSTL